MNYQFYELNVSIMDPKKGEIGLANLGNTCYLNAVLQCLRHVSDLTLFFHKHSDSWIHTDSSKQSQLCNAYKDLVHSLWSGTPPGFLRPAGFLHHFRNTLKNTAVEHMIQPYPHDSHEALVFLLDQLHEGMKKALKIQVMAQSNSSVYGALTAWKDQVAPQYSPIIDYFFGLMEVSVMCQRCRTVNKRYELFNMIKAGFPNFKAATLSECIEHDLETETIEDYQCDACKSHQIKELSSALISHRIWRLPHNLIVVVRRFNVNGTKCHAHLDAEESQVFTKWFSPESPETSKTASYTLQSIVDHHGSANGGHYTAQVKSPFSHNWNQYDDESVRIIGNGSKPSIGNTTYILFYRRSK
jgi:hypothetical protein